MNLSTIAAWLDWIAAIHTSEIELGLDRVKLVAERLQVLAPPCPVIIVGGTNGKGSTVAALDAIYRANGYQVGTYTSPFLFQPNEQIRVNGAIVSDESLCAAFAQVAAMRGDVALTPFEFFTLAAFVIFQQQKLDVWVLEVGLGGRLDAVNLLDADVAVVTSIDIDHVEWLGATRELIAIEKAGIFRPERPAVCGDREPPATLVATATNLGTELYCQGRDFDYVEQAGHWSFIAGGVRRDDLPMNALMLQNMATVMMVITLMQKKLPVTRAAIATGLTHIDLMGRVQIIPGAITEIYDVAHNPAAVRHLANELRAEPCAGKTYAVFSMLADKDMTSSIDAICAEMDGWFIAPLQHKRGANAQTLQTTFTLAQVDQVTLLPSIQTAYAAARAKARAGDRIIIFGSFHTVAEVWKCKVD